MPVQILPAFGWIPQKQILAVVSVSVLPEENNEGLREARKEEEETKLVQLQANSQCLPYSSQSPGALTS